MGLRGGCEQGERGLGRREGVSRGSGASGGGFEGLWREMPPLLPGPDLGLEAAGADVGGLGGGAQPQGAEAIGACE